MDNPEPVEEKEEVKEEKKTEKRSVPKVSRIEVNFQGRIADEPIYHATLGLFGLDPDEVSPIDRNQIGEIIKLVAQKLGTIDRKRILSFVSRESHSLSGSNKFREMYRNLLLGQESEKRKSPWK